MYFKRLRRGRKANLGKLSFLAKQIFALSWKCINIEVSILNFEFSGFSNGYSKQERVLRLLSHSKLEALLKLKLSLSHMLVYWLIID